jgi:OHCU decarboxylase
MNAVQTEADALIDRLNRMNRTDFIDTLADIYEHSPWVAEQAASLRPFETTEAMAATMQTIVHRASAETQMELLRAHPELGRGGNLTTHSNSEQRYAGFDRLTPDLAERLAALNRAYRAKFGFPFIVAVRGQKDSLAIIAQIERRLVNDPDTEAATAIEEVGKIARFRLGRLSQPER